MSYGDPRSFKNAQSESGWGRTVRGGLLAVALVGAGFAGIAFPQETEADSFVPHVVVATLDTGANPFHPAWRRNQPSHPSTFLEGYPSAADSVNLTFLPTFAASVDASRPQIAKFRTPGAHPYWIPGTSIVGTWANRDDTDPIFDPDGTTHGHGARASSQIAGVGYSMAPDAYVVIMDRTVDGAGGEELYAANAEGLRWAADQPWIDIVHTNIQNIVPLANPLVPLFPGYPEAVLYAISKGKVVVSAGGNWYVESTETSPHAGPPGVLAAGANDNCGYADFSNPNPHVVMDGYNTVAGAANGFGSESFGGTSSASPRITGYVAKLLLEIRKTFGYTGGVRDGALVVLDDPSTWPAQGPLSDGRLTAADLHEVVRKTANPNPHASQFDGTSGGIFCVPQPVNSPVAIYAKMGYGEVSEHTFPQALAVALGDAPMPLRVEDAFYLASEAIRIAAWDAVP